MTNRPTAADRKLLGELWTEDSHPTFRRPHGPDGRRNILASCRDPSRRRDCYSPAMRATLLGFLAEIDHDRHSLFTNWRPMRHESSAEGPKVTPEQIARFRDDGFLILDRFLAPASVARARARFGPLFRGEFETGLYPDEWNWKEGRDPPDLTRQICNAWRSDRTIAAIVLAEQVGRACAQLMGWPGARIAQDNVIWKPPSAKPLGFHQDDSYGRWFVPSGYCTCWIALDETNAAGGTIEYARGSHRWEVAPPIRRFHAPDDYREDFREAASKAGFEPEIVPVEVPAGGVAFHHDRTWHGSDRNRADRPRRSLVSHCVSAEARFHPTEVSYVYSRYKRVGDDTMDESFFPLLWTEDSRRTGWLDGYARAAAA